MVQRGLDEEIVMMVGGAYDGVPVPWGPRERVKHLVTSVLTPAYYVSEMAVVPPESTKAVDRYVRTARSEARWLHPLLHWPVATKVWQLTPTWSGVEREF